MMSQSQNELARIRDLLRENPNGLNVTMIARIIRKSKNTTGRYLDVLLSSGQVKVRSYGMAKIFTLSQKAPLFSLLNHSRELIMVLDKYHRVVEINDPFLTVFGRPRTWVLGKNCSALPTSCINVPGILRLPPDDRSHGQQQVILSLPGKAPGIFSPTQIPTVLEDGTSGITLILEDSTRQIQAENALEESREWLRLISLSSRDGVVILENEKIVYASQRFGEMTGYAAPRLPEISPLNILHPEDLDRLRKTIRDSAGNPYAVRDTGIRIFRRNSGWCEIRGRVSASFRGDVLRICLTIPDPI
ncbi:MAG: PAS domain-containing protein [Methanoregulaceae archaeon]